MGVFSSFDFPCPTLISLLVSQVILASDSHDVIVLLPFLECVPFPSYLPRWDPSSSLPSRMRVLSLLWAPVAHIYFWTIYLTFTSDWALLLAVHLGDPCLSSVWHLEDTVNAYVILFSYPYSASYRAQHKMGVTNYQLVKELVDKLLVCE